MWKSGIYKITVNQDATIIKPQLDQHHKVIHKETEVIDQ